MEVDATVAELRISSTAFEEGAYIPAKYTCEGENINPPLAVDQIPPTVQTLAIIMDDPDAPKGVFDHWLVWNIEPAELISEDTNPGVSGRNSAGKAGYFGPCPPSGSHRYFFHVYALDIVVNLEPGAEQKQLKEAMNGHILAQGSLMGYYQKTGKAAAR